MLPIQPFYPPKVLAPHANLQVLPIFPTVPASYRAVEFSAVELLLAESTYANQYSGKLKNTKTYIRLML